jgi:membrane protease YdiL (CAAX protease family)
MSDSRRLHAGADTPAVAPVLFLVAISLAEVTTAVVNPRAGLVGHALILFGLLFYGARTRDESRRALFWGLSLVPLIRLLSLSLPLAGFPVLYWYAIISVPVWAATVVAARTLGYSRQDLGLVLRLRHLPLQVGLLPLGFALGLVEYIILQPQPLARGLTLAETWQPALILTVSTGLQEELIFRGLLQRAAQQSLGVISGLLYVTALFTVLHTGYLSLPDLAFVFLVGLFFAFVAWRTSSILGVTLCHAGTNIGLFLLWPFLVPGLLGGGL